MTDIIFLSVAFSERYIEQQDRLSESISSVMPGTPHHRWVNEWPYGSLTHRQSLYGFKVHAVQWALKAGYKKIIWLDPACILQRPVDHWFIEGMPPVIAVKDDNVLSKMIGKKAMNYYSNPDITGWHLVGGSLYVFDFNKQVTHDIFNHWHKAEADGIFGSQAEQASEKINGHRNDESCMAVAMYSHNIDPVGHDVAMYNQNEDSIIIKRHFK